MNRIARFFTGLLLVIYFFISTTYPIFASTTYTYDSNGNMTANGTNCYSYNEANQLKQIRQCSNNQIIAEYIYDANGNRIVKKEYTNGTLTKTIYSPSDEFETEKQASTGATQNSTYYFANDQIIAKKNPDGSKMYYQNDHLGSASVLTDQSGNLVEETSYYPFGQTKLGGTRTKYQYTGQEKDPESGLNYYNFRYYDPTLAHFTQPDDIYPNVYDPQSLNRYSYALNNPIRYTDPTGHQYVEAARQLYMMAQPYLFEFLTLSPSETAFLSMNISDTYVDFQKNGDVIPLVILPLETVGGGKAAIKTLELTTDLKLANESSNMYLKNIKVDTNITTKYVRPNGATTQAQRESVQGKPCATCGAVGGKNVADHIEPLVQEYYRTGSIDQTKMKSTSAVQPQCISCSNKQGGLLSEFSKLVKSILGLK